MHKNNPHLKGYDFAPLIQAVPALSDHVREQTGRATIDFADPVAVKCLNQALLKHHYGIEHWDIPAGYLCPGVPGRADYLLALQEVLASPKAMRYLDREQGANPVQVLDIGTGANVIYPLIGQSLLQWQFVGSDIDPVSINCAKTLVQLNGLNKKIQVRQQKEANQIFSGVIKPTDYFHLTMCNPPFHDSAHSAQRSSERKVKNLTGSSAKYLAKNERLNFAGQDNELWCAGGELAFVQNMVRESQQYAAQVGLFSCLISKKENIKPLEKLIRSFKPQFYACINMAQGNKQSRFLVWGF